MENKNFSTPFTQMNVPQNVCDSHKNKQSMHVNGIYGLISEQLASWISAIRLGSNFHDDQMII